MAIIPNILVTGATVAVSPLNENFAAIETALSGNLTEANLANSTRIPNSKLANNDYTFNVTLHFQQDSGTSNWLVSTTGIPQVTTPLPYDTGGTETYTIVRAIAAWRQTSATVPDFQIDWGYLDANGAWQQVTSIVASTAISDSDTVTATYGALQSTLTLANSSVSTSASQERLLAIRNSTTDAWAATAGAFLTVTLKLKRELRS